MLKGIKKPVYACITYQFTHADTTALKKTFSSLNQFLRGEGLFQGDTKIAAQNSPKNNYHQKKIQQHLDYINQQTEQYLAEMDSLLFGATNLKNEYLSL